jgi:L-rhamnose mutarotase
MVPSKTQKQPSHRAALSVGSLITLRPEYEERYIILHKHVFPEVLKRIRLCHIRNYSIFLRQGILLAHFEYTGKNYSGEMASMADAVTKEWWKLTDPMQEPLPDHKEGEWWTPADLLCRIEGKNIAGKTTRLAFVAQLGEGGLEQLRTALSAIPPAIARLVHSARLGNVHVYAHKRSVYLYAEHAGTSLSRSSLVLLEQSALFTSWRVSLEKYLASPWEEMKEVFHTA